MIGAPRDPGLRGLVPVAAEVRVGVIAPFGRLDEGEADARTAHPVPVDVPLPARDVDAVHRMPIGRAVAPLVRRAVAQLRVRPGSGRDLVAARRLPPRRRPSAGDGECHHRQPQQQLCQKFHTCPFFCPKILPAALCAPFCGRYLKPVRQCHRPKPVTVASEERPDRFRSGRGKRGTWARLSSRGRGRRRLRAGRRCRWGRWCHRPGYPRRAWWVRRHPRPDPRHR